MCLLFFSYFSCIFACALFFFESHARPALPLFVAFFDALFEAPLFEAPCSRRLEQRALFEASPCSSGALFEAPCCSRHLVRGALFEAPCSRRLDVRRALFEAPCSRRLVRGALFKAPRKTRLVRRAFVQGVHEKANTSARAHSLQVRKRVCTSSPKAKKRVCTRKPTFPFKRIRLGEETCMHEKANTSVKARSLGRGNVYARESHHFNSNAFPPGGETCIHEFA